MSTEYSEKDHCSFSPDGMFGYYWGDKCEEHDRDYWYREDSRLEVDMDLREDMKSVLPFYLHWIAWLYYFGVRIFGRFFWKELNKDGGKNG